MNVKYLANASEQTDADKDNLINDWISTKLIEEKKGTPGTPQKADLKRHSIPQSFNSLAKIVRTAIFCARNSMTRQNPISKAVV